MDTVLQGPDGKPAVDQQTGMPLTMEEMLRRRGIVRMGNTTSTIGPNSATSAGAPSTVTSSTGPKSGAATTRASGSGNPATVAAMIAKSIPPEMKDAPPQVAAQALSGSGVDPSVVQGLEALGVVAVGTAAAYALYKMRGQGGGGGGTEIPVREGMPAGVPEDAHFTDVGPAQLKAPQSVRSVRGQQQAQLSAPQRRLPAPPATQEAPTEVAKAIKKTPRVAPEPLDAGLARTLGIPSEIAKMLKANPGLLKTLTRIP